MHHTRSSSFGRIVGVVWAKSAQVSSLRRDDRGRAVQDVPAPSSPGPPRPPWGWLGSADPGVQI